MEIKTCQGIELKELLGINERTLRYYKENGFLKGAKVKKKKKYMFSPRDIDFLNLIKSLRYVGFSLSEIKKIGGIHNISQVKSRRKLLRLSELLKELLETIEFKKSGLEQLREDMLNFKKGLENLKEPSHILSRSECARGERFETDLRNYGV